MKKKIELELFRFDIQTDYLPYYTKINIAINEYATLSDLLEIIKENVFAYAYDAYGFKINEIVVFDFELTIESLCKKFGFIWKIEPLNPHLVIKDLVINPESFIKKIEILREYGFKQDDKFILSFLPYAYATPLSVKNKEYLTEAFFVIAYSLYQENKDKELLKLVANFETGIFNAQNLETYLYPQDSKIDDYICEFQKNVLEECLEGDIQKFKNYLTKNLLKE
ncbi:DUF5644 domain-containing protein [Helicobacter mesocricetorum]|uniref:DUF5644 domain-containing protein n=1 Tax=Helicobacter mesocricetorum TaxID=87012 RepID=UPI000CF09523|nr:DUF5644 domain-containing protein [Helicobacter mesocricetorum]